MGQAFPGRRRQPHQEVAREPRGQQLSGFREDVIAGLSLPRKSLPPKYFYDAAGSRLFERICRLRGDYLTRAEVALTPAPIAAIARFAGSRGTLIEYGSGASVKSRLLIRALRPATYIAVDISHDALQAAARRLASEFPRLDIVPVVGDFSRPLTLPVKGRRGGCAVYFPGLTIGNLTPEDAHAFLAMTRAQACRVLVGLELDKDANMLQSAYNEANGVH